MPQRGKRVQREEDTKDNKKGKKTQRTARGSGPCNLRYREQRKGYMVVAEDFWEHVDVTSSPAHQS